MRSATYFLIFLAALATAAIGFKSLTLPITPGALGLIVWSISPYIYLVAANKLASNKSSIAAVFTSSLLMGLFGVWLLVDAMFIHLDAQSALAFVFTPLWQWAFLVLTALPLYFLNRNRSS